MPLLQACPACSAVWVGPRGYQCPECLVSLDVPDVPPNAQARSVAEQHVKRMFRRLSKAQETEFINAAKGDDGESG
jgi:hypothetical protein